MLLLLHGLLLDGCKILLDGCKILLYLIKLARQLARE